MALFLVLSVPLWLLTVIALYPEPSRGWLGVLIPFLGGLTAGMAAISLTLSLLTRIPFGSTPGQLFFWAWIRGPGWALLFLSVFLVVFFRFKPFSGSRIREIACWFGGTGLIYVVWLALAHEPGFDGFRVFYLPFLWLGAISGSVWLLDRGLRHDRWSSWLLLAVAVCFPTLMTTFPLLFGLGHEMMTWILTLPVSGISGFLIFLDSRGRLR